MDILLIVILVAGVPLLVLCGYCAWGWMNYSLGVAFPERVRDKEYIARAKTALVTLLALGFFGPMIVWLIMIDRGIPLKFGFRFRL